MVGWKTFDSSFALVRLFTVDPKGEERPRVGVEGVGDGGGSSAREKYAEHCIRKRGGERRGWPGRWRSESGRFERDSAG